jgi:hypothetical protein
MSASRSTCALVEGGPVHFRAGREPGPSGDLESAGTQLLEIVIRCS